MNAAERGRKWRAANPASRRKWTEENAGHCKAYARRNRLRTYLASLRRLYGLAAESFYKMFADQGEACAICRTPLVVQKTTKVDHCHDTGRVRGILCDNCNVMLGRAKDDPARLRAAADYLEVSLALGRTTG